MLFGSHQFMFPPKKITVMILLIIMLFSQNMARWRILKTYWMRLTIAISKLLWISLLTIHLENTGGLKKHEVPGIIDIEIIIFGKTEIQMSPQLIGNQN